MNAEEVEAQDLLKARGRYLRSARHGTLWALDNGETVLVSEHANGPRVWKNIRAEIRRKLGINKAEDEEEDVAEPTTKFTTQTSGIGQSKPAGQPLLGTPRKKTQRIVIEETVNEFEIQPFQLAGLLRGAGYADVPDDVRISVTNEGFIRLRWVERKETTEG